MAHDDDGLTPKPRPSTRLPRASGAFPAARPRSQAARLTQIEHRLEALEAADVVARKDRRRTRLLVRAIDAKLGTAPSAVPKVEGSGLLGSLAEIVERLDSPTMSKRSLGLTVGGVSAAVFAIAEGLRSAGILK